MLVWQKAMQLVKEIYVITKLLPSEEVYGLCNQMRRAAVSVPSNIAEGYNRDSDKELCKFLYIARGSEAELETQMQICVMLEYFTEEQIEPVIQLCSEVGRMINSFIKKIKAQ